MSYRVGDEVVITTRFADERQYLNFVSGFDGSLRRIRMNDHMISEYAGMKVTIRRVHTLFGDKETPVYKILGDEREWNWTEPMFESYYDNVRFDMEGAEWLI